MNGLMASDVAGQTVPVRFEPYDMGVAYAYIDGQWLECIADAYTQVHGRSEKEWNLILDEWREHQRQHAHNRVTLNGPLLAQFLHQVEQEETFERVHEHEYEEQALRRASLGGPSLTSHRFAWPCLFAALSGCTATNPLYMSGDQSVAPPDLASAPDLSLRDARVDGHQH